MSKMVEVDGIGWIRNISLNLKPPSLKDNTADIDRLIRGLRDRFQLNDIHLSISQMDRVAHTLRETGYSVNTILLEDRNRLQVLEVKPNQSPPEVYGMAVDLGTSQVAIRLVDLVARKVVGESSVRNPQLDHGSDILTRIHFATQEGGLEHLKDLIIDVLNNEFSRLAREHRIKKEDIYGVSVAGNTTMTHLFLGLNPYRICREPYIPVVNRPGLVKAEDLSLHINREGYVLVFPNVGSYVGGDIVAGILASNMYRKEEVSMFLDVGTNAEVVLGNKEWFVACAGAAGPALEGGVARMGMMAGPGVIDQVRIDPTTRRVEITTIEGKKPVGICGSGLIDLLAQLFLAGMIDVRGKYVPDMCGDRLINKGGVDHFIIVKAEDSKTGKDLTLSQIDIDVLLRSKAAMYTILTTISGTAGISFDDLDTFYIAGTFGSYIDPRSAITIGMIPDIPLERYTILGNSSLSGATMALLSARARDEMELIRDRITYIELNVNQEFMNLFSAARFIPHTDRRLFPSVKVCEL